MRMTITDRETAATRFSAMLGLASVIVGCDRTQPASLELISASTSVAINSADAHATLAKPESAMIGTDTAPSSVKQASFAVAANGSSSGWDGSHRELVTKTKRSMARPETFEHVKTQYFVDGDWLVVSMDYRGLNQSGSRFIDRAIERFPLDTQAAEDVSVGDEFAIEGLDAVELTEDLKTLGPVAIETLDDRIRCLVGGVAVELIGESGQVRAIKVAGNGGFEKRPFIVVARCSYKNADRIENERWLKAVWENDSGSVSREAGGVCFHLTRRGSWRELVLEPLKR